MGEIACHSAQWVKPFEAVSDVINLKHTQNQTVNTPQSCFCYNIFSLILLDLVNKLTVHNLPCPSGSFLFLDHICISVLSFFFLPPRPLTYIQLQAHVQVNACVSDWETCSLYYMKLWASLLADLDDISALVYCTYCRQKHTHSQIHITQAEKWLLL